METFGLRNRRAVLGLLVAGMLPALDCGAQQSAPVSAGILESVRPDSRLEIFYLGTPDCPYCQHWEAKARSDLIAWVGETLRHPIGDRHYPAGYLWVYQQVGPSRGVPRFLLAIDGKVRLNTLGTNRYSEIFLPILRQVAERRANPS